MLQKNGSKTTILKNWDKQQSILKHNRKACSLLHAPKDRKTPPVFSFSKKEECLKS